MKLKVKLSHWSAGRPVAILNHKTAEKMNIHVNDRILIQKDSKEMIVVVDLARKIVKEGEVYVSTEIIKHLNLKKRDKVDINVTIKPKAVKLIDKKLEGGQLNEREVYLIIKNIVNNAITEPEIAYFISGVYKSGMTMKETIYLTKAIFNTGKKIKLRNRKVVDKHSVGGVPGRTTPIIVSICAAAGLLMPKTSSRAITTPSGTADAMEVICKVDFSIREIKTILKKAGACMVWGGSLGLAPADDKIIQVEKILNLDPQPQLLASIMAKKLAVNAKYVLIDIPYGKNAKVNLTEAQKLKRKFKKIAKYFNITLECFLEDAEEPIGKGVGPALEIKDALKVLRREDKCYKLEHRSLQLAAKLLELTDKAKKGQGYKMAKKILDSGKALKKFQEIVKAQHGDINKIIGQAKYKYEIRAEKSGRIKELPTNIINNLARISGCPLDKKAGLYIKKHVGEYVRKGEEILTIYAQSKTKLKHAIDFYKKNKIVKIS